MSGASGSSGDGKKGTPPSNIVTRNGARKSKIQTRAMSAGAKPSASVVAAKKKAQQKKKQNVDTVLRDHYQAVPKEQSENHGEMDRRHWKRRAVDSEQAMDSKYKTKGPTGFVTEPRMAEHRCLWDANYPECPERLISVIDRCKELDLISQCEEFPPRSATKEELLTLHSASVYDLLETTRGNQDLEYLEEVSSRFDAVYVHPSTQELALIAAGSTIDMVDRICRGAVQNGAAFVRPPGHHAMRGEPCGYCFYNNAALAAQHALTHANLNRILIVDWDVHHGQATQQMFYDDPRVVYFSIHRYEHGSFWPNLRHSDFHYVGTGRGSGYNFNVPLNQTGMADADYLAIWHQLLLPMAFEYRPELIIVSAGYDAAIGCFEGEMQVTPACYAHLVSPLAAVSAAVCVVLEGGYCLPSLAEGAALTLRTLLGHPPPALPAYGEPCHSIRETILNCIYAHKPYWKCYNYQPTYSLGSVPNVSDEGKEKHYVAVKWLGDETRPDRFATRDCYPVHDDETKRRHIERLNHLRIVTDLKLPQHPVCYIYDVAMLKHKNICEPGHVECPERILRIHERLREFGLLERMLQLDGKPAADEDILGVHSEEHLKRLKELAKTKLRDLNNQKDLYDSVYFHPDSLESAAMAAGCVIQAVDCVLGGGGGGAGSGVCAVRPPGHHACADEPSGFCLLNNAAVAAGRALRTHGLARVLILDWDVHHGNGTQALTYEQKEILYISLHRYDGGTFFPNSTDADYTAAGEGRGEGYNVNVPWNKRGMGDVEYLSAMTQVVLPIAYEYNPQLVIVSAGFDAAPADPLGGCRVSPECFGRMTHMLRSLAGGKVILILEGGYNITGISYCMAMCTKALLGDPLPPLEQLPPAHPSAVESINNVIRTHKKYWKSLKFQIALPADNVLEPPLPSRGLTLSNTHTTTLKITVNVIKSRDSNSSQSTLDDSLRSIDQTSQSGGDFDDSLEHQMEKLNVKPKCEDGVHCGTDDDKSPDRSKKDSPKQENKSDANAEQKELDAKPESSNVKSITITESEASNSSQGISETKPASSEGRRTLVDFLAENMQSIVDGEMYAVIPLPWCPHLESLYAIPNDVTFRQGVKCVDCDITEENWVCLHCFITACSRYGNAHMAAHAVAAGHALTLSLADLSVWCYSCDAYVDHALLYDAKNNAHRAKFSEDLPWCYPNRSDTIHLHPH